MESDDVTIVARKSRGVVINAARPAAAFGLSQDEVQARLRAGRVTSCCEADVGDDVLR
ncbi:DUF6522 family protein [Maritimibacter sp. HL-12]|uniref:DUF6522 family protein n=1 Tax=Maritimibacter sp. HL-12 TaxID=1162418 RepID=UPI0034E87FAB